MLPCAQPAASCLGDHQLLKIMTLCSRHVAFILYAVSSRTYLAQNELESIIIMVVFVIVMIIIITNIDIIIFIIIVIEAVASKTDHS